VLHGHHLLNIGCGFGYCIQASITALCAAQHEHPLLAWAACNLTVHLCSIQDATAVQRVIE
jgi:hypothetical protein